MKKYLKENKTVVAAVIVFLLAIIVAFLVKDFFFSGTENALYGNRLKGIDEVKVTSSEKSDVKKSLESDSTVKSAKCLVQGKIVNVIVTVNDDVGTDTAKSLADKVLESFNDDQKKFYDFQVFIQKNSDSTDFPIIGYRQNTKTSFSWTKDRAAS